MFKNHQDLIGDSIAQEPPTAAAADLAALAAFVRRYPRLVILSGAGVSTECGIPDYRDARGAWKRPPPVQHQHFMASLATRQRYWARSLIGFRAIEAARPGPAHRALARLEALGHVSAVITQNVDGLHQRAGSKRVIDLHGRAEMVRCMGCDALRMRHDLHAELAHCNPDWHGLEATVGPDGDADLDGLNFSRFRVNACARCGDGILKPDVVFFGDNVPPSRVAAAFATLREADALLVVGSSLMVYSGFRFARQAARDAKPIACLNRGLTRADDLYALKLEAPVGPTLEALVASLQG